MRFAIKMFHCVAHVSMEEISSDSQDGSTANRNKKQVKKKVKAAPSTAAQKPKASENNGKRK